MQEKQGSGVSGQGSVKRRIRVSTAPHGGTEVHCNLDGKPDCEGFPDECDHCAGWVGWGLEIKRPAKLITVTIEFDLTNVPPEKLPPNTLEAYKNWAADFKTDMENDPDLGRYIKAEISIEEG